MPRWGGQFGGAGEGRLGFSHLRSVMEVRDSGGISGPMILCGGADCPVHCRTGAASLASTCSQSAPSPAPLALTRNVTFESH